MWVVGSQWFKYKQLYNHILANGKPSNDSIWVGERTDRKLIPHIFVRGFNLLFDIRLRRPPPPAACLYQLVSINLSVSTCLYQLVSIDLSLSKSLFQLVYINLSLSTCFYRLVSINMCLSICLYQLVAINFSISICLY